MNKLWQKYEGFIFDMDGTIYIDDKMINGAVETLNFLISKKKHILFVTNKTTNSCEDYRDLLTNNGITVSSRQILTSSKNIINYFKTNLGKKIFFAIAEDKFIGDVEKLGFEFSEDPTKIETLIVTLDRNYTERKSEIAKNALINGADFFAANIDNTCPTTGGEIKDAGVIISDLEKATGRRLQKHFGKPSQTMIKAIKNKMRFEKANYLLIGDRLETDILMGNKMGVDTALVSSGIINNYTISTVRSTYTLMSIKDIIEKPKFFMESEVRITK